jgi:hypothetical protein
MRLGVQTEVRVMKPVWSNVKGLGLMILNSSPYPIDETGILTLTVTEGFIFYAITPYYS